MPQAARQALREIRQAVAFDTRSARQAAVRPAYPWPAAGPGLVDVLWPMALHLGPEARAEVEKLEATHRSDDALWQTLNRMAFDS